MTGMLASGVLSYAKGAVCTVLTIEELLASVLDVPVSSINEASGPATLKAWSSLKHIQFVAALEETYGISLTPREIQRLTSLDRVRSMLRAKGVEIQERA